MKHDYECARRLRALLAEMHGQTAEAFDWDDLSCEICGASESADVHNHYPHIKDRKPTMTVSELRTALAKYEASDGVAIFDSEDIAVFSLSLVGTAPSNGEFTFVCADDPKAQITVNQLLTSLASAVDQTRFLVTAILPGNDEQYHREKVTVTNVDYTAYGAVRIEVEFQ